MIVGHEEDQINEGYLVFFWWWLDTLHNPFYSIDNQMLPVTPINSLYIF